MTEQTEETDETVVRREVTVDAPLERAFAAFTEQFGDIKPKEHNLLASPIVETTFEPRVGSHIFDRAEDGSECRWARVLAYEPPNRVVFSWDISPYWQLEANEANASEVEVRFIPETAERTRVELEHRNLDRHGPVGKASATASLRRAAGRPTWPATRPSSPRAAERPIVADRIQLAADERQDLADLLDTLTSEQWVHPSLCERWTVRDVVAHLISHEKLSYLAIPGTLLRGGFRLRRMNEIR